MPDFRFRSGYKTLGMLVEGGLRKDELDRQNGLGTTYMGVERLAHLVTVNSKGLLMYQGRNLDTTAVSDGTYIFVMSGDGNIYSADKNRVMHHSSFLGRGEVASAGKWRVEKGKLTYINNVSGHYMPPSNFTEQVLRELRKHNVDVSGVHRDWQWGTSRQIAKGLKRMNETRERVRGSGQVNSPF
jgi:hypothetical protein